MFAFGQWEKNELVEGTSATNMNDKNQPLQYIGNGTSYKVNTLAEAEKEIERLNKEDLAR